MAFAFLGMISSVSENKRQQQARKYARLRRRAWFVRVIIGGLYALTWLSLRWGGSLRRAVAAHALEDFLIVAIVAGVFGIGYFLLVLPLLYYSSYVIPHRFHISTQTIRCWISDQAKGALLGVLLGLLLVEVTYALIRALPGVWWVAVGVVMLVTSVVMTMIAPVLIFPIFYEIVPLGHEHQSLMTRLMQLTERCGTRVLGVYKFDMSRRTTAANAALMGMGNTRRIVLGDTMLSNFTPMEIEAILAHELGHHVYKDIPMGIMVGSIITLGGLYIASIVMHLGVMTSRLESVSDAAGIPLLALVMGAYRIVTMPISNAYSRWCELRADAHVLKSTGNGSSYASALTKLADQNLAEWDPEPWVEFMLYTHPALNRRIAMAEGHR